MANRTLLVINLGTPNSTSEDNIAKYLREFLMDKNVISLPIFLRWFLVNFLIIPKRKAISAKNYKKIWDKNKGSPLLFNSQNLVNSIKEISSYDNVVLAMRYGNPSIKEMLPQLQKYHHVDVLPLYPHKTKSSYLSAVDKFKQEVKLYKKFPSFKFLPPFYNQHFFIDALTRQINKHLIHFRPSHFIFSYHGIPLTHLRPTCQNICQGPCDKINDENKNCYRAQCFETSRLIAKNFNLEESQFSTVFQSRLGRSKWITPYLSDSLLKMAHKKYKKVAILSPSFIVDCLETLEELKIAVPEKYQKLYPDAEVKFIPCLNDEPQFAKGLADWAINSID